MCNNNLRKENMKKTFYLLVFAFFAITCTPKQTAFNKVCPVSGEEVDTKLATVNYNGKNFGFCCEDCEKVFKENPAKYATNLNESGTEYIKPINN